jgi:hypothetical protein
MIIIRMQGGLGNQLFQYALYETFRQKGFETKVDISAYEDGKEKRELGLAKLGLRPEVADRQQLHRYYADNMLLTDRVFRYLFGQKKYWKEKRYDFNPHILEVTDGFLSGYWQSEKYFDSAAKEVRKRICFQDIDTKEVKSREKQIQKTNAVSVHVRLGDYLQTTELYGNICTGEYYRKAIQYIAERIEAPVFYVFSDEPERARDMLTGYTCCFISENTDADSYKDMYLMSRCRHHIIANSTFSWWGAWLDDRTDKIVITPPKWNHLCKSHDICCDGWVMMEPTVT